MWESAEERTTLRARLSNGEMLLAVLGCDELYMCSLSIRAALPYSLNVSFLSKEPGLESSFSESAAGKFVALKADDLEFPVGLGGASDG